MLILVYCLFMEVNQKKFVSALVLACGPIVVRAYLLWGYAYALHVAVKCENMEALFDITSIEPTTNYK